MRRFVVYVSGIEQSDKYVDVQERDHGAFDSSRSFWTRSGVIMRPSAGRISKPFGHLADRLRPSACIPLRARSEIILPAVSRRRAASSFAAASTSSSISRVVRTSDVKSSDAQSYGFHYESRIRRQAISTTWAILLWIGESATLHRCPMN
jgi:hypothetical protein